MPLIPTDEVLEQDGDVLFAMLDGQRRIVCRVSREALDDVVGARSSSAADRLIVFERYRERIMEIASRHYDAGQAKPVVTTADLS